MSMTLLHNLVPTVLVAGTALGLAARKVKWTRRRHRPPEGYASLGRIAFATRLVGSRTRVR